MRGEESLGYHHVRGVDREEGTNFVVVRLYLVRGRPIAHGGSAEG